MLVYELHGGYCHSDFADKAYRNDIAVHMFEGVAWYHYFKPSHPGIYRVAGIGSYIFAINGAGVNSGLGFHLAGGYEFAKQVQIGLYYSYGRAKLFSCSEEKSSMQQLLLLVTVVAY